MRLISSIVIGVVLVCGLVTAAGDDTAPLATRHRQPSALAFAEGGKTLLVANRKSGSISVIDLEQEKTVAEIEIGRGLSDLFAITGTPYFLAVDQEADDVFLLEQKNRSIAVVANLKISPDPIRAVLLPENRFAVTSRWSRKVTIVDMVPDESKQPRLKMNHEFDLPFNPREVIAIPGQFSIIVADAFGGKLALIDLKTNTISSIRELAAHNIRGLAFTRDGKTFVLSHQRLNRLARTTFDDVHWGSLLSNHLRYFRIESFLSAASDSDVLKSSRNVDLDEVGKASGDPGGLAIDANENAIVALSGVGEVAIISGRRHVKTRVPVGEGPTVVAVIPKEQLVCTANALDDTISVCTLNGVDNPRTISLGPTPEFTAPERGQRLFRDARLSHHRWMSCQSCHTDGHTNGQLADTLGDGSYGAPKVVPSLLGVACSGPWGWTGAFDRLESQVRQSITTTMQGTPPTDDQVADLLAYLRTLEPPPAEKNANREAISRGQQVFRDRSCTKCHEPPDYTSAIRVDVGLVDEVGNREFNPPSLRGIGKRGLFFHDGRAGSLESAFRDQAHPRGTKMSPNEIDDLTAFLKSL